MSNDNASASGEGTGGALRADGRRPNRGRIAVIVVGAVIVAAVIVVILAFALTPRAGGQPAADPSASSSSEPSASGSADAGTTPSGEASAEPSSEPSTGGTDQFPEQPAVAPDQPGTATGISAVLSRFESVTGEVTVPGEVSAAAVRITVDITNTGSEPVDLDLVVMNAFYGADRKPAEPYEQPGGQPVSGSLEPGQTAQGVYLFRIPEDQRSDATVILDYRTGQPAIVWRGQLP